jgi:hypothetical protein
MLRGIIKRGNVARQYKERVGAVRVARAGGSKRWCSVKLLYVMEGNSTLPLTHFCCSSTTSTSHRCSACLSNATAFSVAVLHVLLSILCLCTALSPTLPRCTSSLLNYILCHYMRSSMKLHVT